MSLDYHHAAGRNWPSARPRRRSRAQGSGAPLRLPETMPPRGQLEHRDAAGRNWTRERPPRRRVDLSREQARSLPYPPREAGGGDHDEPYQFRVPTAAWPFPFTSRQLGRLLALRGRVRDGELRE